MDNDLLIDSETNDEESEPDYNQEENVVFSTEAFPEDDLHPNKLQLSRLHLKPKTQGSSFFGKHKKSKILLSPPLKYNRTEGSQSLIIEKIKTCKIMCDFNDPVEDIQAKEVKRTTLNHILSFVKNANYDFIDKEVYTQMFSMFKRNIFRDFPYSANFESAIEDDEVYYEISWPHLSIVYEILKNILINRYFDTIQAEEWVTHIFVSNIIELFDSRDQREQSYLLHILHSIYTKFFKLRSFIRQYMASIFLRHVHECIFHGIAALLDMYLSIVNGFTSPLKEEHIKFLEKALLPLHTGPILNLYVDGLQSCVFTYIKKNQDLAPLIINYLFVRLPKTPTQFRLIIMSEIERIFTLIDPDMVEKCLGILCKFLSRLIIDENYMVSERALNFARYTFFNSQKRYDETIVKRIKSSVKIASTDHWNTSINKKAADILTTFPLNKKVL